MLQDIIRFSIFGHEIAIHGFGLMLVIGFLGAMQLAKFLAKRSGLDGEVFANACLLGLFTGVIGARMSHVLENLSDFTRSDRTVGQNLVEMVNITSGGLTYYGGFLLAFPTLVIYALRKKDSAAAGDGHRRAVPHGRAGVWTRRVLFEWMLLRRRMRSALGGTFPLRQLCVRGRVSQR